MGVISLALGALLMYAGYRWKWWAGRLTVGAFGFLLAWSGVILLIRPEAKQVVQSAPVTVAKEKKEAQFFEKDEREFFAMTPAQHLEAGKLPPAATYTQTLNARRHLKAIPEESQYYGEAQDLLKKVSARLGQLQSIESAKPAPAPKPPAPPEPRKTYLNRGQEGHLIGPGSDSAVAVAVDSAAYDALTRPFRAQDKVGVAQLLLSGRVFSVDRGTKMLVLDPGAFSTEVRIMEGPQFGRSGIVDADYIKP
jgi:hypothetical protein